MRVMGIRAGTDNVRYVVLETDMTGAVLWVNAAEEHKWLIPKSATTKQAKLRETNKEFERLIKKYNPEQVLLKLAESMPGRAGGSPDRIAVEAVITLAADQHGKSVFERRYQQLKRDSKDKMNTSTVEGYVLAHVAKPASGWDRDLADAHAVALRALGK